MVVSGCDGDGGVNSGKDQKLVLERFEEKDEEERDISAGWAPQVEILRHSGIQNSQSIGSLFPWSPLALAFVPKGRKKKAPC